MKVEANRRVRKLEVAGEFALTSHAPPLHIGPKCFPILPMTQFHFILCKYNTLILLKSKDYFSQKQNKFTLPHLVACE
jgi:hypothetical protein